LPSELAGGCSTHHAWNDRLGHGPGGTSRGIHAAWHTTACCVQPPRQRAPIGVCSRERSSDVLPRQLRPSPVASLCATFSFNFVRSPRPPDQPSGHTPLAPGARSTLGDPGDPHRVDTALVEEQRGFPTGPAGFRPCLCPHRTLFLCCRCAKRKLVGASKARCSDRCPLPNRCRELGRRIPALLLEEGLDLCRKDRAVEEGATSVETGTRRLYSSPVCIRPDDAVPSRNREGGTISASGRDTNEPLLGL